jgi:hypothetical protein
VISSQHLIALLRKNMRYSINLAVETSQVLLYIDTQHHKDQFIHAQPQLINS